MTRAPKTDTELVWLLAEAEAARLILERGIRLGLSVKRLTPLVDARAAALEALAEHMKLVDASAFAHYPACDPHVPHQRKNSKNHNPAA